MTNQAYTTEELTETFATPRDLGIPLPWVARTENLFILGPGAYDGSYAFGINIDNPHGQDDGRPAAPEDTWHVASFVTPETNRMFAVALSFVERVAESGTDPVEEVSWF